jgi:hypothetical protein
MNTNDKKKKAARTAADALKERPEVYETRPADRYARRMSFDEARELVFRENREALRRLAQ